jgi:hypothetical protein
MKKTLTLYGIFFIISLPILSSFFSVFAMQNNLQEKNINTQLLEEAQKLKASNIETWESNVRKVEKILSENFEIRQHWKNRGAPPLPSIEHLNLSLAFLTYQLQNYPLTDFPSCYAYLTAIAKNPDRRRIELLETYITKLEQDKNFSSQIPHLMTSAADIEWASQQIPILIEKEKYISTYSLLFNLLDRFAKELPQSLCLAAYNHIHHYWPKGPTNGDGERYWDLLIRIDPKRARHEILPYFNQIECDLYVVRVLEKNASPSEEIAQITRKWLTTIKKHEYELYGTNLRILLLKSAPKTELTNTINLINNHLKRLKTNPKIKKSFYPNPIQKEVDDLLESILQLDLDESVESLVNWVHQENITDILRFHIIEWLVKHQYKQLPVVLARWLKKEPEYLQNWVRSAAKQQWGKFGQEALQKAEKLISEQQK